MKARAPLEMTYPNPVGTELHDAVFGDMARSYELPGTEVRFNCLPETDERFTHHRVPLE